MTDPVYLSLADVLGLHAFIMRQTDGSASAVRDERLLESALERPRMAAHYNEADLIQQSAILTAAISQAQAFVDGNKRTAFIASDVFLSVNGLAYVGSPLELAGWLVSIAGKQSEERDAAFREFASWLRGQVMPASQF